MKFYFDYYRQSETTHDVSGSINMIGRSFGVGGYAIGRYAVRAYPFGAGIYSVGNPGGNMLMTFECLWGKWVEL